MILHSLSAVCGNTPLIMLTRATVGTLPTYQAVWKAANLLEEEDLIGLEAKVAMLLEVLLGSFVC